MKSSRPIKCNITPFFSFMALIFDQANGGNPHINSDMLKFILDFEAWGNKTTKKMYHSLLSLKMISFVLFPQASQPSMNFNISELVY